MLQENAPPSNLRHNNFEVDVESIRMKKLSSSRQLGSPDASSISSAFLSERTEMVEALAKLLTGSELRFANFTVQPESKSFIPRSVSQKYRNCCVNSVNKARYGLHFFNGKSAAVSLEP